MHAVEVPSTYYTILYIAGEFLRQAQELIEKKMHPQTVVAGYRLARDAAMASLEKVRTPPSHTHNPG